mgnify:CR=1 FL=1
MARGLSGALVVEEADGGPEVDSDEVLLIDDWRLAEDAQIAGGFGNMHDWAHAGRVGNWITVNGNGDWRTSVQRHSRHRLRLVNTANARIFSLEAQGLAGWIVALDGMPLDAPQPLGHLTLAPAQRADIIVDRTLVLEFKATTAKLGDKEEQQAVNYLQLLGLQRAMLINFGKNFETRSVVVA